MLTVLFAQGVGFRLGMPELVSGSSFLVILAFAAWSLIDAAKYPDKDWAAIGRKKGNWVFLILATAFFCGPFGLISSIYYLVVIRANLQALHRSSF